MKHLIKKKPFLFIIFIFFFYKDVYCNVINNESIQNEDIFCKTKTQFVLDRSVFTLISKDKFPIISKYLDFLNLTSSEKNITSEKTLEKIAYFLESNEKNFPQSDLIKEFFEKEVSKLNIINNKIKIRSLNLFLKSNPISTSGWILYIKLSKGTIYENKSKSKFKLEWENGFQKLNEQKIILNELSGLLTRSNHFNRCVNLIIQEKYELAINLVKYLNVQQKKIIKLALDISVANSSKEVKISSSDAFYHPLILYKTIQLYNKSCSENRNKKYDIDRMYNLIVSFPISKNINPLYYKKLWPVRNKLTRELIKERRYSEAYILIKKHNIVNGNEFIIGEWLSGWLSLVFLKQIKRSQVHFYRLYQFNSNYHSTKSRASFWIGESYRILNKTKEAIFWYKKSAFHPKTFYGQLALSKLFYLSNINFLKQKINIRKIELKKILKRFQSRIEVQAIYLLYSINKTDLIDPFIKKLKTKIINPEERELLVKLVYLCRGLSSSILTAIFFENSDLDLTYPILENMSINKSDKKLLPIIHSIIRQESCFNPKATSKSGAVGLMQIMPATAKEVEKNIKSSDNKSLTDIFYNVKLASNYLKILLSTFSNNLVLSIAAYNAGPTNVKKWIREFGDPRNFSDINDIVNWIELIPFSETRNYVHRVLENYLKYLDRFEPIKNRFMSDILFPCKNISK